MAKDRVITTRITLDEGKILDALASVTDTPVAEIIRRYISAGLEADTSTENLQKIQKQFDEDRRKRDALMADLNQKLVRAQGTSGK